jgi:hypothetical protein
VIIQDPNERAQLYVDTQAQTLKAQTEHAIEETLLNAILDTLQFTERMSVWLLAITGASFPLLLSNTDAVLQLVTRDRFRGALILLIASALFGAFAKARDMQVQVWRHLHRSFLSVLPTIFERHDRAEQEVEAEATLLQVNPPNIEFTVEHIVKVLEQVAPRFYRRKIRKAAQAGPGDPLGVLKQAVRFSNAQAVALIGQLLFFLAAVVVFVWP